MQMRMSVLRLLSLQMNYDAPQESGWLIRHYCQVHCDDRSMTTLAQSQQTRRELRDAAIRKLIIGALLMTCVDQPRVPALRRPAHVRDPIAAVRPTRALALCRTRRARNELARSFSDSFCGRLSESPQQE